MQEETHYFCLGTTSMKILAEAMNCGEERGDIEEDGDQNNRGASPYAIHTASLQAHVYRTVQTLHNGSRTPRDLSPNISNQILKSPRLDGGRRRKLVLHFDLRNTMLVADSVTNVSVEQGLNAFLTAATWGQEVNGRWVWHSDQPSIRPPQKGVVTYYKYLERQLVRTPSERTSLRLATGDFTLNSIGSMFRPFVDRHLEGLRWEYEGRDKAEQAPLTVSGSDGQPYHYILEGVYRLLHYLVNTRREFAFVIRTYGLDAENVLCSLAHGLKGHHPGFRQALNIPVNRAPGYIHRPEKDAIVLEAYRPDSSKELLAKLSHEKDIYRFLSNSQGISGYKDDFQHWQSNNYNHHAGKPLWVDPHDTRHHHIIFDDNFRALDEDSIVDVRVFSKEETTRGYSMSKTQLSHLEDVCLVQADLMESIDDLDYFIKKVELCETNYARMLKLNAFPV